MRLLNLIFWTAVAVSIVHYTDNYFNFADYPEADAGPTKTTIGIAWFVFTAIGLAGYLLYRRGRVTPGCGLLALYSGSGLVGIGHYTVDGMTGEVWWRQAHVVADILLGVAVLVFAVWSVRAERSGRPSAA